MMNPLRNLSPPGAAALCLFAFLCSGTSGAALLGELETGTHEDSSPTVDIRSTDRINYCDEKSLDHKIFEGKQSTHFVVADFRPRSEQREDVSLGRTAANAVEQVLRDHLLRVALQDEDEAQQAKEAHGLDVYRLRCVVKDATQALAVGSALGADLVLWGDAVCPTASGGGNPLVSVMTNVEARNSARINTGPITTRVELSNKGTGSFCARVSFTAPGWSPLVSSAAARSASILEETSLELPQVVAGDALGLTLFVGGLHFFRKEQHVRALRLFRSASRTLKTDSKSAADLLWAMGSNESLAGQASNAVELFVRCQSLAKKGSGIWWACRRGQISDDALQSHTKEARKLAQEALELARKAGTPLEEARALMALGELAISTPDMKEARDKFEAALCIFRAIGSRTGEADALEWLCHMEWADLKQAKGKCEAALSIFRLVGDSHGEANTLLDLGVIALRTSREEEARLQIEPALALFRSVGNRLGEASALMYMGDMSLELEVQQSRDYYEKALAIVRDIGYRRGEAQALSGLGDVARRVPDVKMARSRYEEALRIFRLIGDRSGESNALHDLGELARRTKDTQKAQADFNASLSISRAIGDRHGEANNLYELGRLSLGSSEFKTAQERFNVALALFRAVGDRLGEARVLSGLGETARGLSNVNEAQERYKAALTLFHDIGVRREEEAEVLMKLGQLSLGLSDERDARSRFETALTLYRSSGAKGGEAEALTALGDIHVDDFELKEARTRFEAAGLILHASGARPQEAGVLMKLALVEDGMGDYSVADRHRQQGREIFVSLGLTAGAIAMDYEQGMSLAMRGALPQAREMLNRAHQAALGIDDKALAADILKSLNSLSAEKPR